MAEEAESPLLETIRQHPEETTLSATLIVCKGAREITREELATFEAPPPSKRWHPVSHLEAADTVQSAIEECGYTLSNRRYSVARNGHRLLSIFDLYAPLTEDRQVNLAVAVLNSTDQSWPMTVLVGNRVTVCWNLSMSTDLSGGRYKRKHSLHGRRDFAQNVNRIVSGLNQQREIESRRIDRLRTKVLTPIEADALILRMFDKGIISSRQLPGVIKEWREPSYDTFASRSAWSLLNAATTVLGKRSDLNPTAHVRATMRLTELLAPKGGDDEFTSPG